MWWLVGGAVAALAAVRGTWSPCGLSMVAAINPISERSRGHRYGLTVAWFVAGAVLGGLALGGVGAVGAVLGNAVRGSLPGWMLPVLAAACCLFTLASDLTTVPWLPDHPRQVNERWLSQYRRWIYSAGFGIQIGAGVATYIMTAAVYLVPVVGALSASPAAAVTLGGIFGLVRGGTVGMTAFVRSPGDLMRLHRRLDRLAPASRLSVEAAQAAAALAFGWMAFGVAGIAAAAVVVLVLTLSPQLARRLVDAPHG